MHSTRLLLPILLVALVGCGDSKLPPPVPVSGKVTLKGKAVEGAVVTFLAPEGGRSASGRSGSDGSFKLTTVNTDDGAPPGEYTITIAKVEARKGGDAGVDISDGNFGEAYGQMMGAAGTGNMSRVLKNTLPEKYAKPGESGLKRTVVKGEENSFIFDL